MFKDQKQAFIRQSSFIFTFLQEKGQPGLFHLPANSESCLGQEDGRKFAKHPLYNEKITIILHTANETTMLYLDSNNYVIMPPTSKKLREHIGFGLCVHASVLQNRAC